MRIIISESQYKRLISESFEFGNVKIVEKTIDVTSQDEYDIVILYYNFMKNVYKFFIDIKKDFLDKFPLSSNQTSFCSKQIGEYQTKYNKMYGDFTSKIKKYQSKSASMINLMNNYMNYTLDKSIKGSGIIEFNPTTNTTNITKLDEIPNKEKMSILYFWNCFFTEDFVLLKPVLKEPPVFLEDLKGGTYTYDEESNKITTKDGKKSTVYTNESDCEKAMKIYEEQLKIYNENEALNKTSFYKNQIREEEKDWTKLKRPAMMAWTEVDEKDKKRLKKTKFITVTRKKLIKDYGYNDEWLPPNQSVFGELRGEFADGNIVFSPVLIKYWNNPYKPSHIIGHKGYIVTALYPKPIKPICDIPKIEKTTSIDIPTETVKTFKPFTPPPQITTNKTVPVTTTNEKPAPVVKTNFVVQWQENGKQKIKFFPSYEEWNNFVNSKGQRPFISKRVNNAKTEAGITYSSNPGLTADGSWAWGNKIYSY